MDIAQMEIAARAHRDEIRRLRAENAQLRERVEELEQDFTHAASLASKHEQRAEAAEAELDKLEHDWQIRYDRLLAAALRATAKGE